MAGVPAFGRLWLCWGHPRRLRARETLLPPGQAVVLAVIGPWRRLCGQMAWTDEPPAPRESQGSGQRPGVPFPR